MTQKMLEILAAAGLLVYWTAYMEWVSRVDV